MGHLPSGKIALRVRWEWTKNARFLCKIKSGMQRFPQFEKEGEREFGEVVDNFSVLSSLLSVLSCPEAGGLGERKVAVSLQVR